jgi:tetratricopeptide (TPR) repeat protein
MSTTEAKARDADADARTMRQVNTAIEAQDIARAAALAKAAVEDGLKDSLLYNLIADDLQGQGRYAEAMTELQRAYELAPRDVLILNAIGRCLIAQNRVEEALKVYDASLAIEPEYPNTHVDKADALALVQDFDQARNAFRSALALLPDHAGALSGLAAVELRLGAVDEARDLAERALALEPNQPNASVTLAEIEAGRSEGVRAERLVRGALAGDLRPEVRAHAESVLGDALDSQARYGEAFASYSAAGDALKALHAGKYARPGQPTILEMVRWLRERFEQVAPGEWRGSPQPPRASDPKAHVFFLGFPRSGTTLFEQILASHPDVVALDERQVLADATRDLYTSDAKLDRLKGLDAHAAATYRDAYWRDVARYCPPVAGKVFVDKHPLNTNSLGLIAKLFPEAKVVFAERDPRDVVLSCFRRRFRMNPAMYELCTLAGAAVFYDAVMRLGSEFRAKLALPFHEMRYERLVENLRRETEAVGRFIGLAWDDAMLDFPETARSRRVRTPSARQVVRGLYSQGVGQWRSYRAELEPVLPLLAPWVEAFGYPAD